MKMVSCAGCDQPIKERFLDKILDRTWHTYCVTCFDCKIKLSGKCFSRDGKLFCKQDFFKRFGTKCSGCSQGISPEDYVRWARSMVYHIRCFTCVDCQKELSTGDEIYILDDNRLLCKRDYLTTSRHSQVKDELMQPDISMTPPDSMSMSQSDLSINQSDLPSVPTSTPEHLTASSQQQQQQLQLDQGSLHQQGHHPPSSLVPSSLPPHLHHQHSHSSDLTANGNNNNGTTTTVVTPTDSLTNDGSIRHRRDSSVRSGSGHHKQNSSSEHKPTRVRTVLNEKQLTTLRSCYNANPRPDALLKERLVEMTGLSARVIRVWFQNKRCKDKKKQIMMKQIQQQEKDGRQLQSIANMQGVPLVATSPVQHEIPHPIEVQSYHPPWKTFVDYTQIQTDFDPDSDSHSHSGQHYDL